MTEAIKLGAAFVGSWVLALAFVPVAIRLARRTDFLDRPSGHKAHAAATPYLGGIALLGAFLPASLLLGGDLDRTVPLAGGAVVICLLGTLDDRRPIAPVARVAAEMAAAVVIWTAGLGWSIFASDAANLALTVVWLVVLINAFNLMDNLDGAAASVALAAAVGLAVLALSESEAGLAALLVAVAGACAGFLRFNLALPRARIFLGDGGSTWLGFVIATAVMSLPTFEGPGLPGLVIALLLVALPVLDTALVVVSRTRRGVSILTGGRDHLTHRVGRRLACPPAAVAAVLAGAQATASLAAVALSGANRSVLVGAGGGCLLVGTAVIVLLERPSWNTHHAATGPEPDASSANSS